MNHLVHSKSKYLLQHATNPVDWYPWSEEAFSRAAKENKPLLVSIGYASCHWCHVMEKESFEDEAVAYFMNQHFVCIKVDKEEHPDVDHFYMDALQSLSGSGGWPLNMFVTPEKKPFYGGTYFPPKSLQGRMAWLDLLKAIANAWKHKPEDVALQSEQMMAHLRQVADSLPVLKKPLPIQSDLVEGICYNMLQNADKEWGGFGTAPKFPASFSIKYLLDFYSFQKRSDTVNDLGQAALNQAILTLDKMLAGGIYDQVGGGFFRYATDAQWSIPHYEKMLYDNALMISVLAVAYRVTQKEHYKKALKETITFCNRELKDTQSPGFYCSLDADVAGKEGAYYIWTITDWHEALANAHPAIAAYYGMHDAQDVTLEQPLVAHYSESDILQKFHFTKEEWIKIRDDAQRELLAFRETRKSPEVDDKMLLSWNALMNRALQEAAIAIDEDTYLEQANTHLNWMVKTFNKGKAIGTHVYKDGESYIDAKLDDLAFLANAMLFQAQYSGNNNWIEHAAGLIKTVFQSFQSENNTFFYYSAKTQKNIPLRKIDTYDGAQPSANAIMAENLMILGYCYAEQSWRKQAEQMLMTMAPTVHRYGRSFAYWASLIQQFQIGNKQLVITATRVKEIRKKWFESYFPEVITLSQKTKNNRIPLLADKHLKLIPQLFLCSGVQCLPPFCDLSDLKKEIKKNQ